MEEGAAKSHRNYPTQVSLLSTARRSSAPERGPRETCGAGPGSAHSWSKRQDQGPLSPGGWVLPQSQPKDSSWSTCEGHPLSSRNMRRLTHSLFAATRRVLPLLCRTLQQKRDLWFSQRCWVPRPRPLRRRTAPSWRVRHSPILGLVLCKQGGCSPAPGQEHKGQPNQVAMDGGAKGPAEHRDRTGSHEGRAPR